LAVPCIARSKEAGLTHRVDRARVPLRSGFMYIDCAGFEIGCMVSEVPRLLRRRKERGVLPDRPWVNEYRSILLNANGLRKGPCCGYTLSLSGMPDACFPVVQPRWRQARQAGIFEGFVEPRPVCVPSSCRASLHRCDIELS
ncbi:MAG: hypothetical protein RXR20_20185, partial [Paraburkholderia sp.]